MASETGHRAHVIGRIARKPHYCTTRGTWAADHRIRPGDPYLEHIAFPGHDVIDTPVPTRMAECAACAESCGRGHLLPPRRPQVTR